ncbi:hypothetical protein NP493_229g00003 [Ridgeia piscesae]|uniref:Uncharacterized protein n=1 Tax=Ridgeia piscesae TaxID=27915 RepID=A0AAD9NZZ1_RIDPI|nr:hypothetical protein NP493_229g00003 [Ridgeia piscesae]
MLSPGPHRDELGGERCGCQRGAPRMSCSSGRSWGCCCRSRRTADCCWRTRSLSWTADSWCCRAETLKHCNTHTTHNYIYIFKMSVYIAYPQI